MERMGAYRQAWDAAVAQGDVDTQVAAENEMRKQVVENYLEFGTHHNQGTAALPNDMFADFMIMEEAEQWNITDQVAKEAGADQLVEFWNGIVKGYQDNNEAPLANWKTTATEEDKVMLMEQMSPYQVDPNVLGNMRQLVAQVDSAMAESSGGKRRIWNHPQLKEMAYWLNREAGVGEVGFIQGGIQERGRSAIGHAEGLVMEGAEGLTDFGLNMLYGGWELTRQFMASSGHYDFPGPPTNYVKGPNGELISNAARPNPGAMQLAAATMATITGKDVENYVADVNAADEWDAAQRSGFENVAYGAAHIIGMAPGFMPAAAAMRGGQVAGQQLVRQGLKYLASGGAKVGKSARTKKIMEVLGGAVGAAVGNGAAMSLAYGRTSDYETEFIHGAVMAPVLMTLGAAGKRVETLARAKNMPRRLAAAVGGGVEGLGFGVMETAETGALWEFVKNPSEDTWQVFAKNMLGFALLKGAGGRSPADMMFDAEARQSRLQSREMVSKRIARGEKVEGLGEAESLQLRDLGELAISRENATKQGKPEVADKLYEKQREMESKMDREVSRQEELLTEFDAASEGQSVGSFSAGFEGKLEAGEGAKDPMQVRFNAVTEAMTGRPSMTVLGRPKVGKGDPVQVPMKTGKVSRGAEGLFKIMESVTRSKGDNLSREMTVRSHEWSHAMMKQALGNKSAPFHDRAAAWFDSLSPGAKTEGLKMLLGENYEAVLAGEQKALYPGAEKWAKAYLEKGDKKGAAKLGSEVWAELFARQLLGDQARLEASVPSLLNWAQRWLGAPEQGRLQEQFRRIEGAIGDISALGASGRVTASRKADPKEAQRTEDIQRYGEGFRGSVKKALVKIKKNFYDDLAEIKYDRDRWLAAAGKTLKDIDITLDPARMMEATRGMAARLTNEWMTVNRRGLMGEKGGESMEKILRDAISEVGETDFFNYLVSVRSLQAIKDGRRSGKGMKSTLPASDYVHTLREMSPKAKKLKELGQRVDAFFGDLVDFAASQGAFTASDAYKIKTSYAMYVPFIRATLSAPAKGKASASTGFMGRVSGGSTREITDLVSAFEQVTMNMMRKAMAARGQKSAYLWARTVEGGGGFAEIIPKSTVPKELQAVDAIKAMIKKARKEGKMSEEDISLMEAVAEIEGISDMAIATFVQKAFPAGERNIIQVPVNLQPWEISRINDPNVRRRVEEDQGKTVWMDMSSDAYRAMAGLDQVWMDSTVAKYFGAPSRWYKTWITLRDPVFAITNFARDVWQKPINSHRGWANRLGPLGAVMDAAVGAKEILTRSALYKEYRDSGVDMSTFIKEGKDARARVLADPNFGTRARQVFDFATRRFGEFTESVLRVKEFKDTKKEFLRKGAHEEVAHLEAVHAAKEVTINFAKGGLRVRQLNTIYAYLNASFLGQAKMFEHLLTPRGMMQAASSITAPTLALWFLNKDEEWYQDLSDWQKRNYWNVKVPGMDGVLQLPKPFELGVLMGSVPEMIADSIYQEDPSKPIPDEFLGAIKEVMIPYLGENLGGLIPQFAKPAVETTYNVDLFRKRPIVPQWKLRSQPAEDITGRYDNKAVNWMWKQMPGFFKELGIDNPAELEHIVGGYVPFAAERSSALIDMDETTVTDTIVKFGRLGKFAKPEHYSSRTVGRFYDRLEGLRRNKKNLDLKGKAELRRLEGARKKLSTLREQEDSRREQYEVARDALEER